MDLDKYNEITSELNAREILRYLNYLGITNISAEALKFFITDLKKLIKYDLLQKNSVELESHFVWSERLYSTSTFSSRLRSQSKNKVPLCSRECRRSRAPLTTRNIRSVPNIQLRVEETLPKRACSCVRIPKKSETSTKENKISTATSNNNFIRVNIPQPIKKNDPVSLYHYYTSLWDKYKSNMPGENNWADLRWTTRQKMAGCFDVASATKKNTIKTHIKDDKIKKM